MKGQAVRAVLIEPMSERHADSVLASYQSGIDDGNATFETQVPVWQAFSAARHHGRWHDVVLIERRSDAI